MYTVIWIWLFLLERWLSRSIYYINHPFNIDLKYQFCYMWSVYIYFWISFLFWISLTFFSSVDSYGNTVLISSPWWCIWAMPSIRRHLLYHYSLNYSKAILFLCMFFKIILSSFCFRKEEISPIGDFTETTFSLHVNW